MFQDDNAGIISLGRRSEIENVVKKRIEQDDCGRGETERTKKPVIRVSEDIHGSLKILLP